MRAFASETLTVTNTPVGYTAGVIPVEPGGPDVLKATFVVEGGPVRITLDETTPTASNGHLFQPGDIVTIEGDHDVKAFKAIRTTAANATLYVTYFK